MNTKEWTQVDVDSFVRFIREAGGQVVEVFGFMNGGYSFDIRPPQNALPNWAQEQMNKFVSQR